MSESSNHDVAILLPGGGARAAYQVGVLRGVARILGRDNVQPFRIICGTSAGAINAATLAVHADNFRRGVGRLLRWWSALDVGMIYHADLASVAMHGMRWFASVLIGVGGPKRAASMLDNAPLRTLLEQQLDLGQVAQQVQQRQAARARHQRDELQHRARRHLLPGREHHRPVAAHAAPRRTCHHQRRSPARLDRDSVRVSRRTGRRRLLRRWLGATDRPAVTGAAPWRAPHPGRAGRPVQRPAAGDQPERGAALSLVCPGGRTCALLHLPRQSRRRPRAAATAQPGLAAWSRRSARNSTRRSCISTRWY